MNKLFSIIFYQQQNPIWHYKQFIYKINISYFNNAIWAFLLTIVLFLLLLSFMCFIIYSKNFYTTIILFISLFTLSFSWYYTQSYIDFTVESSFHKRKLYFGVIFLIITEFFFFFYIFLFIWSFKLITFNWIRCSLTTTKFIYNNYLRYTAYQYYFTYFFKYNFRICKKQMRIKCSNKFTS